MTGTANRVVLRGARLRPALFTVGLVGCAGLSPSLHAQVVSPQPLTPPGLVARAPAWSPDGRLAFEGFAEGDWDLYILDPANGSLRRLAGNASDERYPTWSPDGEALAFVRNDAAGSALVMVRLSDGMETTLSQYADRILFPDWSPDGRRVAFTLAESGTFRLAELSVAGGPRWRPLLEAGGDLWPRYSPDGTSVAFFSRRATMGADDEVHILDLVTGIERRLTAWPGHDFCPAWSRDGSRLVVVRIHEDQRRTLTFLDRAGERWEEIDVPFFRVTEPAWSPDARSLAFAGAERDGSPYRVYGITVEEEADRRRP